MIRTILFAYCLLVLSNSPIETADSRRPSRTIKPPRRYHNGATEAEINAKLGLEAKNQDIKPLIALPEQITWQPCAK